MSKLKSYIGNTIAAGVALGFIGLVGKATLDTYRINKAEKAKAEQRQEAMYFRSPLVPVPLRNQALIVDPATKSGSVPLDYILLTDKQGKGSWDMLEQVHMGATTGDGFHKIYFSPGAGPSQSPYGTDYEHIQFIEVKPEFFAPYQNLWSIRSNTK